MVKIWMEASIKWLSHEQGGRQNPMPGNIKYRPIIVFPGIKTDGSWSADIVTGDLKNGYDALIDLSFLSPIAPFELLIPGAEFELYEGPRLVAKGNILKEKQ